MSPAAAAPSLLLCSCNCFYNPRTSNLVFVSPPSLLSPLSLPTTSSSSSLTFSISSTTPRSYSSSSLLSSQQYSHFGQEDEDEEEEEETVIGDCLVFEDGIFEDPLLEQDLNPTSPTQQLQQKRQSKRNPRPKDPEIEPQNLVPDEWVQVVEQINLPKKERRKLAQQMEFGQRLEKKKRLREVDFEEYLRFRDEKLAQLKPLVLDNPYPTQFPSKNKGITQVGDDVKRVQENVDSTSSDNTNKRVEPKNPRWAVYGRGLDDISEFFNSGSYRPTTPDSKSQGRQKLFTQEEKALMNSRFPKLAIATSRKWLPLHTLAASGEFYLVDALLKHNVDINAADQDGLTALHKAITCKKQAVTNYLLRESANPFVCDKDGASLLHYAVRTASSEAIKTLLLYNVDVNLQDNDGWTPLHLAVQSRRTDVVRLLLIKGADKTLRNKDGLTPLELCLYSGRDAKLYELIKILKQQPRHRP